MGTFELDGVMYSDGRPPRVLDSDTVPDENYDPEGWRYYSDVLTPETVAWKREYARLHPDDDFIVEQVESIERGAERQRQRFLKLQEEN